jgi:hypothetical protein
MYDKAIEEIKEIFKNNFWNFNIKVATFRSKSFNEVEEKLNKDLSDFLKRFEEGYVKGGIK